MENTQQSNRPVTQRGAYCAPVIRALAGCAIFRYCEVHAKYHAAQPALAHQRKLLMQCFIMSMCSVLLLMACGAEPKLDASSQETMVQSIQKVQSALSEERKKKFQDAINALKEAFVFNEVSFDQLKELIHGKTAQEIIADGEVARQRRDKKHHGQREKEKQKIAAVQEHIAQELAQFQILKAHLKKEGTQGILASPKIEVEVHNGTSYVVSRVCFVGTLFSQDRSVPWVKAGFSYTIPGGIEPGEKAAWSISLSPLSEWSSVKAPNDASLKVEVVQLDGPNGKELFSTQAQAKEDANDVLIKPVEKR
jgi:hypothetical protein